jgi:hypothetical protein
MVCPLVLWESARQIKPFADIGISGSLHALIDTTSYLYYTYYTRATYDARGKYWLMQKMRCITCGDKLCWDGHGAEL